MAWLEQELSGQFHVGFRYGTRKFKRSLRTTRKRDADQLLSRVERRLHLLETGDIELPADVDLPTFLLTNGKRPTPAKLTTNRTLKGLFDSYRKALDEGELEANTRKTAKIHLSHLERIFGGRRDPNSIDLDRLQKYIDKRKREPGLRGRKISPTTIRKELTTLSAVWKWAQLRNKVTGPFPNVGLQYPKGEEKPSFMTWDEISRELERGGLSDHDIEELWGCLYLQSHEIDAVLKYAHAHTRHPFIHPMITMAAYTGARRSELIRAQVRDVNLDTQMIRIREKKRDRQKRTYRTVPISPVLRDVLRIWLSDHPCGHQLFCLTDGCLRSRKDRSTPLPLTVNEATDHFNRTFANSQWQVIRGWHIFRHSFASNCAFASVDQRFSDEWMGHQTEEMMKRYRHLLPNTQASALALVFNGPTDATNRNG